MQGFYSGVELARVKTSLTLVPECGSCKADKSPDCHTPKMKIAGQGRRDILIVSETIGRAEDRAGGWDKSANATGDLRKSLGRLGVDLFEDCWLTAASICYGGETVKRVVDFCRPNVLNAIKDVQPKVIVLLGNMAIKSVIGHVWKEDTGGANRWAGFEIPLRKWNAWVCPTWHPMYLTYMKDDVVLNRQYRQHLRQAVTHTERPYETVPDDTDRVELVYDPNQAAARIRLMMKLATEKTIIAFDYETNMIKPDSQEAEIVCCSLSDGKYTFAFPWEPASAALMEAFKEFVQSPIPKVSSNLDMEERWTRKFVGCSVNGWRKGHDTMLDAHALDNRGGPGGAEDKKQKGITGIKFQAFVNLGIESYDDAVRPYLKTEKGASGNTPNRVREVPMDKLLTYCGLDSFYEYLVARIQRKIA